MAVVLGWPFRPERQQLFRSRKPFLPFLFDTHLGVLIATNSCKQVRPRQRPQPRLRRRGQLKLTLVHHFLIAFPCLLLYSSPAVKGWNIIACRSYCKRVERAIVKACLYFKVVRESDRTEGFWQRNAPKLIPTRKGIHMSNT